jgi:hypothetical protein
MMIAMFVGAGSSADEDSDSETDSDIMEVKMDQDDASGLRVCWLSQLYALGVGHTFWVRIHSCPQRECLCYAASVGQYKPVR